MIGYRNRPRRERGSAYLLAIMVLLILTMVGLSVAITTQSEMRIGENERVLRRSFYSADAGLAIATAKALTVPDTLCFNLDLVEPSVDPNIQIRNRLQVSDFRPIHKGWCNLCQVNQDSELEKINHSVTALATRVAWKGNAGNPPDNPKSLAEERLSVMVSFQPWQIETKGAVDSYTGGLPNGLFVSGGSNDSLCGIQEGIF